VMATLSLPAAFLEESAVIGLVTFANDATFTTICSPAAGRCGGLMLGYVHTSATKAAVPKEASMAFPFKIVQT
jgi:hypothetical protein